MRFVSLHKSRKQREARPSPARLFARIERLETYGSFAFAHDASDIIIERDDWMSGPDIPSLHQSGVLLLPGRYRLRLFIEDARGVATLDRILLVPSFPNHELGISSMVRRLRPRPVSSGRRGVQDALPEGGPSRPPRTTARRLCRGLRAARAGWWNRFRAIRITARRSRRLRGNPSPRGRPGQGDDSRELRYRRARTGVPITCRRPYLCLHPRSARHRDSSSRSRTRRPDVFANMVSLGATHDCAKL